MRLIIETATNGFLLRRNVVDGPDVITISSDTAELIEQLQAELNAAPAGEKPTTGKKRGRPAAATQAAAPGVDPAAATTAPAPAAGTVATGVPAAPVTPPATAAAPAAVDIAKLRDAHRAYSRASATTLAKVGGPAKVKELNGKLIDDMTEAEMVSAAARIKQEIDNLM